MPRVQIRWVMLVGALAGCTTNAVAPGADASAAPDASVPASCSRRGTDLPPAPYFPAARVVGACSVEDAAAFAAACGPNPSSDTCGAFLAGHPACARCLLGDALPGPIRDDPNGRAEISAGACAQVLAGEALDAAPDVAVVGCGAVMENVAACVRVACGACDAGDTVCRDDAYRAQCAEVAAPSDVARCAAFDAGACVLGTPEERARAVATVVCGP